MKNNALFIICCIFSLCLNAQEEQFFFDPVNTNKVIVELQYAPKVYEVHESDLIHSYIKNLKSKNDNIDIKKNNVTKLNAVLGRQGKSKEVSFMLGDVINVYTLSGSFEKVANYLIMADDYGEFFKDELVKKSTITKLNISENYIAFDEYNTVIMSSETGKYYIVKPSFLKDFDYPYAQSRLVATTSINREGSMSVARVSNIEYSIQRYESMIKRCKELTSKLIVHNKLVKEGKMTKEQVIDWKRDLVEAKLLNYRINDFNAMYLRGSNSIQQYVNKEALENYYNFSETLLDADRYVGF